MHDNIRLPKYPPVFFVRITERMRRFFIRMYRKFTHPNVAMLEMVQNLWLSGAIGAAAELGIADILKKGPKTIGELAKLTGTLEYPLYRVMRALASNDIFKESKNRCFSLTPLAVAMQEEQMKYFIIQHLNKMHFQMFGEMMHSLKTGRNSSELFIKDGLFDHIGKSPELNEMFNKAMTNTSVMQVAAILPVFPFNKYKNIIDVGGGQGFFLSAILSKFRSLEGIVFDLPHVVSNARQFFEKYGVADRAGAVGGSFFETIPAGGDLYMLKNILHDWNDDECLKILQNIRLVLPPEGRLLVMEAVIEEDNNPSFGKMIDLLMMVGVNGRERTKSEFEALLQKAGFVIRKIYRTVSPFVIITAEINLKRAV